MWKEGERGFESGRLKEWSRDGKRGILSRWGVFFAYARAISLKVDAGDSNHLTSRLSFRRKSCGGK